MLDDLFNSKIRASVLTFLFEQSKQSFYMQEIINGTKEDSANVYRELERLVKMGLLTVSQEKRQRIYALSKRNAFLKELKKLILVGSKERDEQKWFRMEEMPNFFPILATQGWNVAVANEFLHKIGIQSRFSELLTTYNEKMCTLWAIAREFEVVANEIFEKIKANPEWGVEYLSITRERQKRLMDKAKSLQKINLANLSDAELVTTFADSFKLFESMHATHWVQTTVDFGEHVFSRYLMSYLKEKIKETNLSLGDVFSTLTTPLQESVALEEYRHLLDILRKITRDESLKTFFETTEVRHILEELPHKASAISKVINYHAQSFGWLGHGTIGPGWNSEYFVDILASLIRQQADPVQLLSKLESDRENLRVRQEQLFSELKINDHKVLFEIAQGIMLSKSERKDVMFFYFSVINHMHREIARRHYLSLNQLRYVFPHEISKLFDRKITASLLNARSRRCVYHSRGKYLEDKIMSGVEVESYLKQFHFAQEKITKGSNLLGDCASPGRARGKVVIVNVAEDMKKMEDGNILISIATNPDLVPAMKKAAAIITDMGGITCHAAIISRELGVPCVVGVKSATRTLQDGFLIDVDATHGKVTILKRTSKG